MISLEINNGQLRQLIRLARRGGDATSEDVAAFVLLYGPELQDQLNGTVRAFVEEKFRGQNG